MYCHAQDREVKKIKFEAVLHGAEIKDTPQSATVEEKKENVFIFRDPNEYEKMSVEKRKSLTQKMMGMHKRWASETPLNR